MTLEAKVFSSVLPTALVLLGLACFVLTDKYIRKHQKSVMLITLALTAMMIIMDVTEYYIINVQPIHMIRLLTCTFGYIIRPVLIMLFHFFVDGSRKYIAAWCLVVVNTLIYVINLFRPIAFRIAIDTEGYTVFQRAELGYTCHIISAVLLLNLICLTLSTYKRRKKYAVVPVVCVVLLAGAATLGSFIDQDMTLPVTYLTIAVVMSCVFIYIWFHLQIVEKYEEDLLAQQRLRIMVSQIQPHFLYNTIAHDIPYVVTDEAVDERYIVGDADGDGSVTILDATAIQRKLAGFNVEVFSEKAADIEGDGLDITDATKIQRYLAVYGDPYPIGESVGDNAPSGEDE